MKKEIVGKSELDLSSWFSDLSTRPKHYLAQFEFHLDQDWRDDRLEYCLWDLNQSLSLLDDSSDFNSGFIVDAIRKVEEARKWYEDEDLREQALLDARTSVERLKVSPSKVRKLGRVTGVTLKDPREKKIYNSLELHGRLNYSQLENVLDLSRESVRKALERLSVRGIVGSAGGKKGEPKEFFLIEE